jgi:hypothetical integral membrane protein (TIGR02206 family)
VDGPLQPFTIFGPSHLIALAAVGVVSVVAVVLVRRASESTARIVRWVWAGALLAATGIYLAAETEAGTAVLSDFVPLHLCDFAIFLSVFALLSKNRAASELLYFWACSGTVLAMVTPDITVDFPSWRFCFYFVLHGAVVGAAVMLVWGYGLRPRKGAPWRAVAWTFVYACCVAVANWILDTNFLFLRRKPSGETLLDHFGPWPVYLLVAAAVALVLFHLLYLPFRRRAS